MGKFSDIEVRNNPIDNHNKKSNTKDKLTEAKTYTWKIIFQ